MPPITDMKITATGQTDFRLAKRARHLSRSAAGPAKGDMRT